MSFESTRTMGWGSPSLTLSKDSTRTGSSASSASIGSKSHKGVSIKYASKAETALLKENAKKEVDRAVNVAGQLLQAEKGSAQSYKVADIAGKTATDARAKRLQAGGKKADAQEKKLQHRNVKEDARAKVNIAKESTQLRSEQVKAGQKNLEDEFEALMSL